MNNPKISILVPIYNVELFLQRCIDSILAQTFTDWELILVDDGSPDKCPQIADEAAGMDERIKVIHKENGGLLSARQAGVNAASGEYYVFWDSDDTVPADALEILYNAISSNGGYDVVRATGKRVALRGEEKDLEAYLFNQGEIIGHDEYLRKQFLGEIPPYLWNAIYKASLFDDNVYTEAIKGGIKVGEDWVTNLIVGKNVERALVIDNVVYHYFYNPDSIMGSSIFGNEYQDRVDTVLTKMGVLTHPAIADLVEEKAVKGIIRNCFIPELLFDFNRFKRVNNYIKDARNMHRLKETLDRKYTMFIRCTLLFFVYSHLYCFLFKWTKLKGRHRKVIY